RSARFADGGASSPVNSDGGDGGWIAGGQRSRCNRSQRPRIRARPVPVTPFERASSFNPECFRPRDSVPYCSHHFIPSHSDGTKPTPKNVFDVLFSKFPAMPARD